MTTTTWSFGRLKAGVLGILAAATTLAAAGDCINKAITLEPALVANSSDWSEYDATGRKLVHESGSFNGVELTAKLNCDRWTYQAQLSQVEGDRSYDGQTSTGTPVSSHSALRQLQGHLQAGWNINQSWQIDARLSNHTTWRDIASAGGASGYPERFEWTLLSLGSQWTTAVGLGQLQLGARVGQQLNSQISLTLPGKDQTSSTLGAIRNAEVSIGWRMPLSHSWTLQADARYVRTDISQSDEFIIRRSGVAVGVAHQPRLSIVDMPVALRIGYDF